MQIIVVISETAVKRTSRNLNQCKCQNIHFMSVVDLSNIFLRFGSPVEYSRDLPPLLADYLFPLLLFVPEAKDQVM